MWTILLAGALAAPSEPAKVTPPTCGADALTCYERATAALLGAPTPVVVAGAVLDLDSACEGGLLVACFSAFDLTKDADIAPLTDAWVAACAASDGRACQRAIPSTDDAAERRPKLQAACDLGAAGACRVLGALIWRGIGGARNVDTAIGLFQRACSTGSGLACDRLGYIYLRGLGVARDEDAAKAWGRKACAPLTRTGCRPDTLDPDAPQPELRRVDDATMLIPRHEEEPGICQVAYRIGEYGDVDTTLAVDCDADMLKATLQAARAARFRVPDTGSAPWYSLTVHVAGNH